MFPYWLLFGICALGALVTHRPRRAESTTQVYLAFIGLAIFLMIGLRDQVGGDWFSYVNLVKRVELVGFFGSIGKTDPGYVALNWVAGQMGGGLWLVDLFCAGIFTAGLISFCSNQPNPWLALVVAVPYLIIVVAMGYTRQAVAIGLVMFALSARRYVSLMRVAVFVALAAAFHKTAIIAFPLIASSRTTNRYVLALIVTCTAILLYYVFLSSSVDSLLQNYVTAKYSSEGATIRIGMDLVGALLFFASRKRLSLTIAEEHLWRNFSIATLALTALLLISPSSTAVDRLALYIIPLQLLVLSRLPLAWGRGNIGTMSLSAAVIGYSGLVQYIWLTYAVNAVAWLPYRAIWF